MKSLQVWLPLAAVAFVATAMAADAHIDGFPPPLQPADLILRDANVATLDPAQPHAQAIAVRHGRIEAVGSDAGIAHYVGPGTKVIDLHGAFVTPGFIEGHGHLMQTGQSLMQLNVGKPDNWAGIVAMVKAAVAKARPGQWIIGAGWQQNKWNKVPQPNLHGLPLPAGLDAVSPHNPVMLITAARHGVYANAAALKAAGITDRTLNPVGGTIVRDAHGHAIGMLRDTAAVPVHAAYQQYLAKLTPQQHRARREHMLHLAVHNEISKGITTFVDMGENFKTIRWLKQEAAKGLPLRLYVNVNDEPVAALDKHLADYRIIGFADHHFTVRGVGEITSDGALGTRSAWLLKPYADDPGNEGKNVVPMGRIAKIAKIAARDGFQLSVHAIGDRANRETLDLYQKIFTADPAARKLRWRIEHAQHVTLADQPRFAKLGVIASMQSIHACSDAPMVVPRLGEKRARDESYVWHNFIKSGVMVLDGTDTPVEDTNPIPNFYCAVTRAYDHGKKTFFPAQVKTPMQELRDYTWNNAYAIFENRELGSLVPGKLADIDVFSGDLLTMPSDEILRTRVLYTIVGGKVVYRRPGAASWRKGRLFEPMPEFDHAE